MPSFEVTLSLAVNSMKSPPLDAALGVGRFLLSAVCSLTLKHKLLSGGETAVCWSGRSLPAAATSG